MNWKPPYPSKLITKPYSLDYKVLKFQKYDCRNGNAKDHATRFLESMGYHSNNMDLCLEEFFKSLTNGYTWYIGLKPGTVRNWTHLLPLFNAKFSMLKPGSLSLSSIAPDNTQMRIRCGDVLTTRRLL